MSDGREDVGPPEHHVSSEWIKKELVKTVDRDSLEFLMHGNLGLERAMFSIIAKWTPDLPWLSFGTKTLQWAGLDSRHIFIVWTTHTKNNTKTSFHIQNENELLQFNRALWLKWRYPEFNVVFRPHFSKNPQGYMTVDRLRDTVFLQSTVSTTKPEGIVVCHSKMHNTGDIKHLLNTIIEPDCCKNRDRTLLLKDCRGEKFDENKLNEGEHKSPLFRQDDVFSQLLTNIHTFKKFIMPSANTLLIPKIAVQTGLGLNYHLFLDLKNEEKGLLFTREKKGVKPAGSDWRKVAMFSRCKPRDYTRHLIREVRLCDASCKMPKLFQLCAGSIHKSCKTKNIHMLPLPQSLTKILIKWFGLLDTVDYFKGGHGICFGTCEQHDCGLNLPRPCVWRRRQEWRKSRQQIRKGADDFMYTRDFN